MQLDAFAWGMNSEICMPWSSVFSCKPCFSKMYLTILFSKFVNLNDRPWPALLFFIWFSPAYGRNSLCELYFDESSYEDILPDLRDTALVPLYSNRSSWEFSCIDLKTVEEELWLSTCLGNSALGFTCRALWLSAFLYSWGNFAASFYLMAL